MQITITSRHADVGEETKNYARKKLEQVEHLWPEIIDAHLIIAMERSGFLAEITLSVRHAQIYCRARHRDIHIAVDQAVKKVESRLKKLKTKSQSQRQRRQAPPAVPDEITDEVPRLIREDDFVVKALTDREASFHLRASNLHFLVYRDLKSKKLSIVFRRSDGDLGLIELEE